jgi:hypothetical protein
MIFQTFNGLDMNCYQTANLNPNIRPNNSPLILALLLKLLLHKFIYVNDYNNGINIFIAELKMQRLNILLVQDYFIQQLFK